MSLLQMLLCCSAFVCALAVLPLPVSLPAAGPIPGNTRREHASSTYTDPQNHLSSSGKRGVDERQTQAAAAGGPLDENRRRLSALERNHTEKTDTDILDTDKDLILLPKVEVAESIKKEMEMTKLEEVKAELRADIARASAGWSMQAGATEMLQRQITRLEAKHDRETQELRDQIVEMQQRQNERHPADGKDPQQVEQHRQQHKKQQQPQMDQSGGGRQDGEALKGKAKRMSSRKRRLQTESCRGESLIARVGAINAACCSGIGHRRVLQDGSSSGGACERLPKHCTPTCAPVFIAFREECGETMETVGFEMRQVEKLHESCLAQVSEDQGSCGAQIGRRLQRIDNSVDSAIRNTGATAAMIIPLRVVTDARTGRLMVLMQTGRRRSLQDPQGAETVQEFRCECGSGAISSCIPECNEAVHGYELLLTIDESDLRVSCKLHLGIFSWAGKP